MTSAEANITDTVQHTSQEMWRKLGQRGLNYEEAWFEKDLTKLKGCSTWESCNILHDTKLSLMIKPFNIAVCVDKKYLTSLEVNAMDNVLKTQEQIWKKLGWNNDGYKSAWFEMDGKRLEVSSTWLESQVVSDTQLRLVIEPFTITAVIRDDDKPSLRVSATDTVMHTSIELWRNLQWINHSYDAAWFERNGQKLNGDLMWLECGIVCDTTLQMSGKNINLQIAGIRYSRACCVTDRISGFLERIVPGRKNEGVLSYTKDVCSSTVITNYDKMWLHYGIHTDRYLFLNI